MRNGSVTLTANTWAQIPAVIPSVPYVLRVTIDSNTLGGATVRMGYANSGTPSNTNGNIAPFEFDDEFKPGHAVYYASDVAGVIINWTTQTL